MKFQEFLDEGLSTAHSKVEMAIREYNLKYTVEVTNTAKVFHIEGDFTLTSFNNGKVTLYKKGLRGPLAEFTEFDFNKVRVRVSDIIKSKIINKEVEKETDAA